jgi:hypothetical protein
MVASEAPYSRLPLLPGYSDDEELKLAGAVIYE